jgi:alkanesulfonate monooxygenase SsuD/methylene tetrahydromethanopterin reductase-like flavin-dependent oxidoreductase (luciferase family)
MAGQLGMGDAALFLVPRWRDRTDRWYGWTEGIGLGTSIVLVPLYNPMHLAKEVATLQELSGGRFTLGVGVGWHRYEFEFMGVEFKGRGRRADEAIRLLRALWSGERDFEGEFPSSTTRRRSRTGHTGAGDLGGWQLGAGDPAGAGAGGTRGIRRAAPTLNMSAA